MPNEWEPGMPRKRATANHRRPPTAETPRNARETRPGGPDYAPVEPPQDSGPTDAALSTDDILAEVELAAGGDDDGYYKLTPGGDGESWYISYHWKWGRYAKHYVMAVVYRGSLSRGLAICARKVARVRAGTLRPVKDRWHASLPS